MKAIIAAILAAGLLSGCATQSVSQGYRPANYAGPAWHISGTLNELNGKHTITINGQPVIDGSLSLWDGSGELVGQYQGRQVASSCKPARNYQTECLVFVDGERAATLRF